MGLYSLDFPGGLPILGLTGGRICLHRSVRRVEQPRQSRQESMGKSVIREAGANGGSEAEPWAPGGHGS